MVQYIWAPSLQRTMRPTKKVSGMPKHDFSQKEICKGCCLGNNVKKYFPRIIYSQEEILELIHLYVFGPMSSPSLSGYLYYVNLY